MGERKRETVKERERETGVREIERKTDVPKLYTYNEYEHSVLLTIFVFSYIC